ncbi:MAG TPA: CCA tRNA nucleotidyltransferase, partial [Solirubrobacterales bacterium]|nr:CCA tRNA nucleotidyltransferase [Solirubrobacterales bacterium]
DLVYGPAQHPVRAAQLSNGARTVIRNLQDAGFRAFVVGGAVRDLLLGRPRADVDLVVVGDAAGLAARLGGAGAQHERFGTVKVEVDGHEIDLATARSETYPQPGALPVVAPAQSIEEDLERRDFTINAMAVPLDDGAQLIDPRGGRDDLGRGLLRVLHERSFEDDPTRAIRAARYASRYGFTLEPETDRLLRRADLATVSADRRRAELERLAAEPNGVVGLGLLAGWGVIDLREGGVELMKSVEELLRAPHWAALVPRERALIAAALGPEGTERVLATMWAPKPGEGVELAERRDPVELILARAMGASWLDQYLTIWRDVKLEIDGGDLIAKGIPEGPAIGRGLRAAWLMKLEGEISGREEELTTALAAALRE